MECIFLENRTIVFAKTTEEAPKKATRITYNNMESLVEYILEEIPELAAARDTFWIDCGNDEKAIFEQFLQKFKIVEAGGGLVKARFPENDCWKYLYIYRFGLWDLPKGKKENGETDSQNACREVMEETGIAGIQMVGYIHSTYHFIADKNGGRAVKKSNWFEMETADTRSIHPQTEEGITQVEWLTVEEIKAKKSLMYSSIAYLTDLYFGDLVKTSK